MCCKCVVCVLYMCCMCVVCVLCMYCMCVVYVLYMYCICVICVLYVLYHYEELPHSSAYYTKSKQTEQVINEIDTANFHTQIIMQSTT